MNRFQNIIPMSEGELVENNNICDLLYDRLNHARKSGNFEQELKFNQRLYEKVFERYMRGPKNNRGEEANSLIALSEDSQKIMLQLNHWEGTA